MPEDIIGKEFPGPKWYVERGKIAEFASAFDDDARAFRRVFGHHTVLGLRFAAAGAWGSAEARRVFSAGGSGPSPLVFDFGRKTIALLRGFGSDDVAASRAAVVNIDLRLPIARVQRGAGSWPIFLRSIHGAGFLDAGSAWNGSPAASGLRTSVGGEVALDLVLVHYVRATLATGAAWIRDPVADRSAPAIFSRIGYAF